MSGLDGIPYLALRKYNNGLLHHKVILINHTFYYRNVIVNVSELFCVYPLLYTMIATLIALNSYKLQK